MTDTSNAADRMRAAGLFDLQPTLAGLLAEVARFLTLHRIDAPVAFTWTRDPSRGWTADLELEPADLLRVFVDWPMPIQLAPGEAGELLLRTEARAARFSAKLRLGDAVGQITPEGLLLRAQRATTSPAGAPSVRVRPG